MQEVSPFVHLVWEPVLYRGGACPVQGAGPVLCRGRDLSCAGGATCHVQGAGPTMCGGVSNLCKGGAFPEHGAGL